jgi:hypothetical protein
MDSTMAATDCAIKQVRHNVVLGESTRGCVPSRTSNNWKPQEWATWATVATSSRAAHKEASNFAPAVFVSTFTIVLLVIWSIQPNCPNLAGYERYRDSSTRMAFDWNLLSQ